ncbi:MAG: HAMP domain-containing histidine kinase [Chloroflexi bacterium]|nr:HAMP domain-containing histidine kinase [Chloroflexota bacterium]
MQYLTDRLAIVPHGRGIAVPRADDVQLPGDQPSGASDDRLSRTIASRTGGDRAPEPAVDLLPTPADDRPPAAALSGLRWAIVLAVLLLTLIQPTMGRTGLPIWAGVLGFALYNLAVEVARRYVRRLRPFGWVPLTDLLVVGWLYALDGEPNGPLFVLFFLAVISMASTGTLRAAVLYTIAVGIVVTIVAPVLPGWSLDTWNLRDLGTRLVVLTLVGVGTALLTRRLTAEQQAARQMRDETVRLEELNRLRGRFISTVSHDLRTPLTALRAGLGMLETSVDGRLAQPESDLLANARRNTERLVMFIDDLLAVNQVEAGAVHLEVAPLDLRQIAWDAASTVTPLIVAKQQNLIVQLPEPLPTNGDRRRLEQAVVNLLANAHHHTPSGTRIVLTGWIEGGDVVLAVWDDGPGIPEQEQELIFQRFYRRGQDGGSGLGLGIAKVFVELHGGRLWLESAPGRGATFYVALSHAATERQGVA